MKIIKNKILSLNDLIKKSYLWRFKHQKIVFTNGCFDILHFGHVYCLLEAKKRGDILVVGLNSDASVKRLKGKNRPVQKEYDRAALLAGFYFVDAVCIFEEDTPIQLIENLLPDVLVKGGDYIKEEIVGYETLMRNGGEVHIIPYLEGLSTTQILNKKEIIE